MSIEAMKLALEPVGEVVYVAKGHLREVLNGNAMNAYLAPEPDRFADVALYTHPAPSVPDVEDLRDRLVAISAAVADSDDRAAQSMLGETLRLLAAAQAKSG